MMRRRARYFINCATHLVSKQMQVNILCFFHNILCIYLLLLLVYIGKCVHCRVLVILTLPHYALLGQHTVHNEYLTTTKSYIVISEGRKNNLPHIQLILIFKISVFSTRLMQYPILLKVSLQL